MTTPLPTNPAPGHLRRLGRISPTQAHPRLCPCFRAGVLPEPFAVVGDRALGDNQRAVRARMREAISDFARVQPPSTRVWDRFAQGLLLSGIRRRRDVPWATTYLKQVEQERGTSGNRLFYVSTPPRCTAPRHAGGEAASTATDPMGGADIIEKRSAAPRSAGANEVCRSSALTRGSCYRIDHYLAGDVSRTHFVSGGPTHLRAVVENATTGSRADHVWASPSRSRAAAPTNEESARCAT